MKGWIALTLACVALSPAAAGEQWEFLLGGTGLGSETVEESPAGFAGDAGFTYQGTKIETVYRITLDASGAPASYDLTLALPGVKVSVSSSVASGSMTLSGGLKRSAALGTRRTDSRWSMWNVVLAVMPGISLFWVLFTVTMTV